MISTQIAENKASDFTFKQDNNADNAAFGEIGFRRGTSMFFTVVLRF